MHRFSKRYLRRELYEARSHNVGVLHMRHPISKGIRIITCQAVKLLEQEMFYSSFLHKSSQNAGCTYFQLQGLSVNLLLPSQLAPHQLSISCRTGSDVVNVPIGPGCPATYDTLALCKFRQSCKQGTKKQRVRITSNTCLHSVMLVAKK